MISQNSYDKYKLLKSYQPDSSKPAGGNAISAAFTFFGINGGKMILYGKASVCTGLFTHAAANTAVNADGMYLKALGRTAAGNNGLLLDGKKRNQFIGARIGAHAAANTASRIHMGNPFL